MNSSKNLSLSGRVALVTGAGRGLGRAYAISLAAHGAAVAVNSRSPEAVAEVVDDITRQGGHAIACPGDLLDTGVVDSIVRTTVAELGHLEILVNNAGGDGAPPAPFAEIPRSDRDIMIASNLNTTWDVTAAAWPHLAASGSGRVILTSSALAFYGVPGLAHYAAAKGAIVGLTRTLAVEGADVGLRVNALKPIANTGDRKVFDRWPGSDFPVSHVAAVLAWMSSEQCQLTGEIISAGGTRTARISISENDGHIGTIPFEGPDDVAAHVDSILTGGELRDHRAMAEFNAFLDQIYGPPSS